MLTAIREILPKSGADMEHPAREWRVAFVNLTFAAMRLCWGVVGIQITYLKEQAQ